MELTPVAAYGKTFGPPNQCFPHDQILAPPLDVLDVATPVLVAPAIPPFERLRPRQATTVRQQRREVIEEGDSFFGGAHHCWGEARNRRGGLFAE